MELSLRRRRKGTDFKPPKDSRFVQNLLYCLLPLVTRTALKIVGVEVDEESLNRVRSLKTNRAVLMPNHPTDRDSVVMFRFSRILGERFNYLAARELFDFAPVSWVLQRCGVYSVMRGTNDRKSFKTTVELLVKGKQKLVIFPEGLTCWQNDTVMPFHEGVPLFGFWALTKLAEFGAMQPLYLVPVAIKYIYVRNMHREIDRSLKRLERRLGVVPAAQSLYQRLREVGESVLSSAESEYGVRPKPGTGFDARLQNMKDLLVNRIAIALGITFRPDHPLAARIRTLVNTLNNITHHEPEGSEYRMELHKERRAEVEHLYQDLSRVLHFVATYDGYVRETMTTERFLDVIGQLEREVFGERRARGPCRVCIRVGKPVNLAEYFDSYQKERHPVLTHITEDLEESVRKMLAELSQSTPPLKIADPT